ncbi:UNVERIFIED_CONTAM: Glycosyltransferase family 64 protein C4 [Sesamum latifolium]|uniref:Glycosyltransferase family 64 protein C4 n=1 Tax=Sesamum latifolium TaxID=2727402 RepID=A0AAW2XFD0_9LAMI
MRTSLFSRRTIRQGAVLAVGSAKIKLLLACCILFTIIALSGRTTSFMGWKQYAGSLPRSSLPRYDSVKSSQFSYDLPPSSSSKFHGLSDSLGWYFTILGMIENGNQDKYTYSGWWSVWWTGTYSMILSKAAFFHKKYLSMYTYEMPSSIRDYVTKNRNCEDIAMSFLVANATGAPPIWVKGSIFEIGSTGISSLGGHHEKRTQCVNWFAAEYGRMPLLSTSVKAVDSRCSWFW